MRKLKPFAVVLVVGAAVVAFGLAAQDALSEGQHEATKSECTSRSSSECGMAKTAAMAKAAKGACSSEAKAEGSACGAPAVTTAERTGVEAAIADMQSGKCPLTSGKYGPAVTAAVVTALYAVAEEETAAVQAIDRGSCPYAAVAAAMPVSEEKKGSDCSEKECCSGACETAACGKSAENPCVSQQAKAEETPF
jgi:hypothetical protein